MHTFRSGQTVGAASQSILSECFDNDISCDSYNCRPCIHVCFHCLVRFQVCSSSTCTYLFAHFVFPFCGGRCPWSNATLIRNGQNLGPVCVLPQLIPEYSRKLCRIRIDMIRPYRYTLSSREGFHYNIASLFGAALMPPYLPNT